MAEQSEHGITSEAAAEAEFQQAARETSWWRHILGQREMGIFVAAVVLFIILTFMNQEGDVNKFIRPENLITIARQISLTTILAVGMTFIIISGEIDLSVGSAFAVTGIVLGLLIKEVELNPWLALVIVLGLGTGIGLINAASPWAWPAAGPWPVCPPPASMMLPAVTL